MKLFAQVTIYGDAVDLSISNEADATHAHRLAVANMHDDRNLGSLLLEVTDITKFKCNVVTLTTRVSADVEGATVRDSACITNDGEVVFTE